MGLQQSFSDITIINCALNLPLIIISIFANSLVLVAMWTATSLRSPSTVFLCCLTVSDILVGLLDCSACLHCHRTYTYSILIRRNVWVDYVSLRCFSLYNGGHKRRQVLSSSLSHDLSTYNDCKKSSIYHTNCLAHWCFCFVHQTLEYKFLLLCHGCWYRCFHHNFHVFIC